MDQFEALLEKSRTGTERWVRAHVGNTADAEDILQETYLAAFRGFPELRNPDAFLPWILGIAKRKTMDWYRAQARRKEIPVEQLPERAADGPDDNAVEETLDALPERDRMMLRMFYREMMSHKEISAALQIPEGTVKSRMSMARCHFRTAYPYPPRGVIPMLKKNIYGLPELLPDYTIAWKDEPAFPVDCEEMMGWFIVPKQGEKLTWGIYDLPSRKLDVSYEMEVTGPASVHGLDGVSITAKVIEPKADIADGNPMKQAVDDSTGGQEEWKFIAQEQDGYTRFLAAEHMEDGKRVLTTFLDGKDFLDNWGFGDDNCGSPVHLEPRGKIIRKGDVIATADEKAYMDVVGRCSLMLDGKTYDTVCVMDFGMYVDGIISEQFLDRNGRTVLWRRFNRDDWAMDRYGKKWSEILPENERLTVNGQTYVHWYDCLCVR